MTSQSNQIVIAYENFLSRPVEYGWEVTLTMHGNIHAKSWEYIRGKVSDWEFAVNTHFIRRNRTAARFRKDGIRFIGVIEGRPECYNLHAHLRVEMKKEWLWEFRQPALAWANMVPNGDIDMRPLWNSKGSEGYIAKLAYEKEFSDRLIFSRSH